MIKYIGDISAMDALVLKELAETHDSILEFGCGASTQVMAKYKKEDTLLVSIDTSQDWIKKTRDNLNLLGIKDTNIFFDDYLATVGTLTDLDKFDFIFDDGVDALRRAFAINIWPHLKVGGILAMHDTRRAHDFRNVLEILAHFQNEIGEVVFNICGSNITTIQKIPPQPYDNWQIRENREPWMLGYGEIPDYYKKLMKEST